MVCDQDPGSAPEEFPIFIVKSSELGFPRQKSLFCSGYLNTAVCKASCGPAQPPPTSQAQFRQQTWGILHCYTLAALLCNTGRTSALKRGQLQAAAAGAAQLLQRHCKSWKPQVRASGTRSASQHELKGLLQRAGTAQTVVAPTGIPGREKRVKGGNFVTFLSYFLVGGEALCKREFSTGARPPCTYQWDLSGLTP